MAHSTSVPVWLCLWFVLSNIIHCHRLHKVCIFVKQTPDGSRSACSGRFRSFTIASSNSGPSGSANRRCTKIANKRSQTKDLQFWKFPIVPGLLRPCLFKSAHFCGQTTLSQFIVGKTGLLKNRHPTTDTDRVFRSQHVACQRRLHRCLRDQQP
jgi:hypothetical protein